MNSNNNSTKKSSTIEFENLIVKGKSPKIQNCQDENNEGYLHILAEAAEIQKIKKNKKVKKNKLE
uniref:Uncharacterized protein n=1 Tax=Meloidogyne hapla TaxID=6305 RepID=A0A1I8BJH8_MELHA